LKHGFSTESDNLKATDFMEKGIDLTPFRAIAEQASDAIIFADARGVVRFWNESAKSVFGYSGDEALGRSLDLIIPERLRQGHWEGFRRAIETGQTRLGRRALVTRAAHKGGHKLYVELSFAVITDMDGKVAGAVGIARDITSRYGSDSALRKRLSFLEDQHQKDQKQK
jgi:PAS domain S-box-containing protein